MKTILTLLIALSLSSCRAQTSTDVVLAKGVIYNWQIGRFTSYKTTDIYFNFKFVNSNTSTRGATKLSYGYIGFVGLEEKPHLIDFIYQLRWYANSKMEQGSSHYYRGHRFEIEIDETYLYLYDWDGNYVRLTKPNAKALATDIEKSTNLFN